MLQIYCFLDKNLPRLLSKDFRNPTRIRYCVVLVCLFVFTVKYLCSPTANDVIFYISVFSSPTFFQNQFSKNIRIKFSFLRILITMVFYKKQQQQHLHQSIRRTAKCFRIMRVTSLYLCNVHAHIMTFFLTAL